MKYSQFNSIIPYKDHFALYNAFENKVIFLEYELKELLLAGINENIDDLKNIHPDFYHYLVKNQFIINNTVNEVEKVKKLSKKVDENIHEFLLTINPTMNCNFKCWYCYETHIKNSRLEDNVLHRINRFITNTLSNPQIKYFNLAFFGGEPLLYFKRNVTPIIEHIIKESKKFHKKFGIGFTTNGYLINDSFIHFFKERNLSCHLQITLDGDREKHNQVRFVSKTRGSYNEIILNIKELISHHFPVQLRINYTEENLESTRQIVDDILETGASKKDIKNYLLIDYHRVWQDDKVDDLNLLLDKNMAYMREKGFEVKGNFTSDNVLSSCYADKRNSAVINYNGDIYKCTARDFTRKNRNGYLNKKGELIWEDNHLEKRMNAKFHNKPCLSCRLLPICNGGCSQHAIENLNNEEGYCVYSFSEGEKDKTVKQKVDEIIQMV